MARKLLTLLLGLCLAMVLTTGAWAQEPPENQPVQSSAVRDLALVAVGLLGGWGGAFITGWWSTKNLDKQLKHEAEQNRLSREEQRRQLTTQLTMQQQMLSDQLEQQTREYMRAYRQERVEELFDMIVALDEAIDRYKKKLIDGEPADRSTEEIPTRLAKAVFFLGQAQLSQKGREVVSAYLALLDAIEKNPSAVPVEHHGLIALKTVELAELAEKYIALG